MKFKTFRMCRGTMLQGSGDSGFYGKDFISTARTFKGRTLSEATKKMDKFIRESRVTGSFILRPEA